MDAHIAANDQILCAGVDEYPGALPMGKILSGVLFFHSDFCQTLGASFLEQSLLSARFWSECHLSTIILLCCFIRNSVVTMGPWYACPIQKCLVRLVHALVSPSTPGSGPGSLHICIVRPPFLRGMSFVWKWRRYTTFVSSSGIYFDTVCFC